ncbi:hypothetical protein J4474_03180 [Candidatus Pacearchaeota archaeon]|nr:hypothetical protein [Candidatus Pacearchaeota archaeon]
MSLENRTTVETDDFQNPSILAKILGTGIRGLVIPLSITLGNYKKYKGQSKDFGNLIGIGLENLARVLIHPGKFLGVVNSFSGWFGPYMEAQKNIQNQSKILVYTDADILVPFEPDKEGLMYDWTVIQPFVFAGIAAKLLSKKEFSKVAEAFIDLNTETTKCFANIPTIMPRFTDHKNLPLAVMQFCDKPFNNYPSGHCANAVLLYGMAQEFFKGKKDKEIESFKYGLERVIGAILGTKQHGIPDAAGGISAGDRIFEKNFGYRIPNLIGIATKHKDQNPEAYEAFFEMYEEISLIDKRTESLLETGKEFFSKNGYKVVHPSVNVNLLHFDRKRKEIIYTADGDRVFL